jgi:uncharacterized Zn finger protein
MPISSSWCSSAATTEAFRDARSSLMPPRMNFGATWWGTAWIEALERSASLDPSRLARGRTYARNGSVGELEVGLGYVSATVRGTHGRRYRTDVAVKALADQEWEQVADAIAARAAHAAALLDGELDPGLVDDAAQVDVRLLPGAGDLRPDCSCPDWAEPCKHAAAVCYLVANELDRDPFQLFLLRGIGREDLLALVRARRSGATAVEPERPEAAGVIAADAWADQPLDAGLGDLPDGVPTAGTPRLASMRGAFAREVAAAPGLDPTALEVLAGDAVERAWSMLVDGAPSRLNSSTSADLGRWASTIRDRRSTADLAARAGVSANRLAAWAEAWQMAGDDGVTILADDDRWSTDQERLEGARTALMELGFAKRSVGLGYDSLRMKGGVWIVSDWRGRWYKLQEKGQRREMHLVAGPADDVVDLVEPPD